MPNPFDQFDTATNPFDQFDSQEELTKQNKSLGEKAIGVGEATLQAASGIPAGVFGPISLMVSEHRGATPEEAEKYAGEQMGRITYQPRTEKGQEYSQAMGEFVNKNLMPLAPLIHMPSIKVGEGIKATEALLRKEKEIPKKGIDTAIQELNSVPNVFDQFDQVHGNEGLNKQQTLFDIPEEGRMPNPYEAVTGDWRIDENGIPIKADLSMDAQNAETPLQRNLWGDELPQKHEQENVANLPQAIDMIPDTPFKGDARDQALSRLQGEVPASGELQAAKLIAESPAAQAVPFNFKKQGGGVKFDWSDNNKVDQLKNIPGVGDRLKEVGHAGIETPEKAVELAKTVPDVSQNAIQQKVNLLTKGGAYLKAKVNNPIVHYSIDRLLEGENKAKAEISDKLHGTYLESLRSLNKQEYKDAFAVLNAADLNKKPITLEFMIKHGFSENLQSFILTHQKMMDNVLGKINEARTSIGKKPMEAREAYSAMNMSGDFRKVAYKTIDGEKQVVGVIGANTKNIGKNSLSKLEVQMKAKDPTLEFGPLQDTTKIRGSSKGTPHEAFSDALKTLGEDNSHFKEFLDTLAQVAKDDPYNYMGMKTHTLGKKGIWGMEGRKEWLSHDENAKAFFENQVKYIEGAYTWGELSKAAKDVNSVIRDQSVIDKHPNAIKLTEDYMQNVLGLSPSRVGRGVTEVFNALFGSMGIGPSVPKAAINTARQVANTWMLSLSPSFLAIQLIQPVMAMPAMMAFLRSRGIQTTGVGATIKAMNTLTKVKFKSGELSGIEQGAVKYAKDNHVYATDMVEHSNQTQKGTGYYVSKVTQAPAAQIETGTRAAVYMSLVHALNEGGLTPKTGLYQQAQRFTDMAMNNYSASEKPAIYNALGPLGSMAYNLKSFGHNEISRWSMYAREMQHTGNAAPLLTQMATTIVFAGVMGLPFFSQWEQLYDSITKALGKPRSLAMDVMNASETVGKSLGEKGAYALSHGGPAMMGMDISTRIGLGDIIPTHAADAAFAGGGKLFEMGKATGRAILNPNEENLKAAAINLVPPVAQGPLDLAWYTKGNLAMSKDPTNFHVMARRNDADKLLKAIGISGINESVQKQKTYQNQQLDKAYQDIRNNAMSTLTQDIFRNRKIDQASLDKYFIKGQGDPQTFEQEINQVALKLNLTPNEMTILKNAASQSVTKARSLQRRTQ